MASKVYAVVSQKGGVGKSSTAVSLGLSFALEGKKVLIADMDSIQKSACEWYESRAEQMPNLVVKAFKSISDLAIFSKGFDVVVADGAPHASAMTLELAEVADKVIIPSGTSMLDLRPSARLALELIAQGISPKKIGLSLFKTQTDNEASGAVEALSEQGLKVVGTLKASAGFSQALDAGRGLQEASHPSLKAAGIQYVQSLRAR